MLLTDLHAERIALAASQLKCKPEAAIWLVDSIGAHRTDIICTVEASLACACLPH